MNNKMAAGSLAAWNVSELSVRPFAEGRRGVGRRLSASWPQPDLFWLLFTQPAACVQPETIARKLPERQQPRRTKLAECSLGIRWKKKSFFFKEHSVGRWRGSSVSLRSGRRVDGPRLAPFSCLVD